MKSIKKTLIFCSALFLGACTNLDFGLNKQSTGPVKEIKTLNDSPYGDENNSKKIENQKVEKEEVVKKQDFSSISKKTTNESINEYLGEIKTNLKTERQSVQDEVKNSYIVYMGETLLIPLQNENSLKVTSVPRNAISKASISNKKINFRSIYKGNYVITTYLNNELARKISILVESKYNFSENEIYDIIIKNSKENNKNLENSITLYKMLYPTGKYYKDVNYLLLKYGYENKNDMVINEAFVAIRNNFTSFTDNEKIYILKLAKTLEKDIVIPSSMYNTTNHELKKALDNYIGNKTEPTLEDLKEQAVEATVELKTKLKDSMSNLVGELGSNSKKDGFFEKIIKNVSSDSKQEINNLKKALSTEKSGDKKSEIYYNIASLYAKQGNKVEATKYLKLLKQEFPDSKWIKKVETLIK